LPYNYHILVTFLKTALESYVFILDESVQEAVVQWLRLQVGYAKLCITGACSLDGGGERHVQGFGGET
jgi:hypothetical protein